MREYEDVRREFGYSDDLSLDEIYEDLEGKHQDAMDKCDNAYSRGNEARAQEIEQQILKLEAALAIIEDLRGGVELSPESDEEKLARLQVRQDEEPALTEFAISPAGQTTTPPIQAAPSSAHAFDEDDQRKIENSLKRGYQDIEDQNWDDAEEHFDEVLDIDAENAEAYYGLWIAKFQLNPHDIPRGCWEAYKTRIHRPFEDTTYKRILKFGDSNMRAQMEDYKKGCEYLIASEYQMLAKTDADYQHASGLFRALGDFADASKRADECDSFWKQRKYDLAGKQAATLDSTATDADFMKVAQLYKELGNFLDAKENYQKYKNRAEQFIQKAQQQQALVNQVTAAYAAHLQQFYGDILVHPDIQKCKENMISYTNKKNQLPDLNTDEKIGMGFGITLAAIGFVVLFGCSLLAFMRMPQLLNLILTIIGICSLLAGAAIMIKCAVHSQHLKRQEDTINNLNQQYEQEMTRIGQIVTREYTALYQKYELAGDKRKPMTYVRHDIISAIQRQLYS